MTGVVGAQQDVLRISLPKWVSWTGRIESCRFRFLWLSLLSHGLIRELRNSALRSSSPAFTARSECDAVVVLRIKRFPGHAGSVRNVGTRGPYRYPPIFRPCDARAIGKRAVDESPRLAAVSGDRRGRAGLVGFAIIAADDHAMIPIAKCDRKNACRLGAGNNRRLANRPVLASIR